MQIGQVIRKYRREQNMTQEEMAYRLGVTTPAVNKWENGNSYPDIMMLAPIARLLNISLDTLLSYREELTKEEIEAVVKEAYKAYEELLFSGYQMLSMIFNSIYILAMEDNDIRKAGKLVDKQQELARLFERGTYYEVSCRLEFATANKDVKNVIDTMEKMLESIEKITDFKESELYEHMNFKKTEKAFIQEMKNNLLKCFQDEETFGFMKTDERWKKLFIL